ncbi:collagen alpha-1(I) chain-like [Dipodomys merriami]|uniref:collagen alpha-1(I) chain-like n=1 Tax=Dipodomys merriami TaxID=94247 RepID=UPI00385602D0
MEPPPGGRAAGSWPDSTGQPAGPQHSRSRRGAPSGPGGPRPTATTLPRAARCAAPPRGPRRSSGTGRAPSGWRRAAVPPPERAAGSRSLLDSGHRGCGCWPCQRPAPGRTPVLRGEPPPPRPRENAAPRGRRVASATGPAGRGAGPAPHELPLLAGRRPAERAGFPLAASREARPRGPGAEPRGGDPAGRGDGRAPRRTPRGAPAALISAGSWRRGRPGPIQWPLSAGPFVREAATSCRARLGAGGRKRDAEAGRPGPGRARAEEDGPGRGSPAGSAETGPSSEPGPREGYHRVLERRCDPGSGRAGQRQPESGVTRARSPEADPAGSERQGVFGGMGGDGRKGEPRLSQGW